MHAQFFNYRMHACNYNPIETKHSALKTVTQGGITDKGENINSVLAFGTQLNDERHFTMWIHLTKKLEHKFIIGIMTNPRLSVKKHSGIRPE